MRCSVHFSSVAQSCPTLCNPMDCRRQASLSITNYQSLLKLMSIESVMPPNRLILCHPLLLLPSIIPSIRVFSNESVLRIRWPKYQSFSFNISPSNECSGLTSFRMNWLELKQSKGLSRVFPNTTVQKHQFFSTHSAFFIVQLSHPYMTTGKMVALTRQTFVGKVKSKKSLLLNMHLQASANTKMGQS